MLITRMRLEEDINEDAVSEADEQSLQDDSIMVDKMLRNKIGLKKGDSQLTTEKESSQNITQSA